MRLRIIKGHIAFVELVVGYTPLRLWPQQTHANSQLIISSKTLYAVVSPHLFVVWNQHLIDVTVRE